MMLLNLIPMVLGYLLKVVMFRFRGFGNDYAKGFHEAWVAPAEAEQAEVPLEKPA